MVPPKMMFANFKKCIRYKPVKLLPIRDAATPVGASIRHFGFVGSSPAFLRIFSQN